MKRLAEFRDLPITIADGVLDGRHAAGDAAAQDLRVLLNVDTASRSSRGRLPGWTAWRTDDTTNEDLHDQLLGAQGVMESGNFVVTDGQREVITTLQEAKSSNGTFYNLAATKSRIYASTGQGKNWRILADGLAGEFTDGETPWPNVRMRTAQIGDYVLFTNNIDPVLAWPIGGGTITEGPNADRMWAAFEVYDLLGLGITRAGVVAGWKGFAFIGDTVTEGTRYPSRIYWSDGGAPLLWAPGGESLAGYVDLGGGETVLAIETIGGQLRCYTDKAIYSITLIGGDAVFQFTEIYRGDLALAFQNSLVNAGDVHMWMVQDSIVALGPYDRVPNRYEWMHRAAGLIFRGLDGRLLENCPVGFDGFEEIDRSKCHQIAAGYDETVGNIWMSWPTRSTDTSDFEGTRRLTLILNPRYGKATLVDYGFSAFAMMRKHSWETVRDFMIENGVCSEDDVLSDDALLSAKEGFPLNTLEAPETPPLYIWNSTEDPSLPMSDDSVAARVCDRNLSIECKACVSPPKFAMASTADFAIKEFDISSRLRELYLPQQSTDWIPENVAGFPNVSAPQYGETGYPTLIQGEVAQWGVQSEKIVNRLQVVYDAEEQTTPGKLLAQIGVTNSPHCIDWHNADPIDLDCRRTGASASGARASQPAQFHFFRAGSWMAYRIFLAATEPDGSLNYSPTGCGVEFSRVTLRAKPKNETWANQ